MGSQGGQLSREIPSLKESGRPGKSLPHIGTLALGTEEPQLQPVAGISHLDVAAAGAGAIRKDATEVK